MNKKGIYTLDLLIWFLRIFFVVIVIFVISLLIRKYVFAKVDVGPVDRLLIENLLLDSDNIFYTDPITGKVDNTIVDWTKISSSGIEKRLYDKIYYGVTNRHAGAKIEIKFGGVTKTIYYNKKFFNELFVQTRGAITTVGRTRSKRPVSIFKNNKVQTGGVLKIEVLEFR